MTKEKYLSLIKAKGANNAKNLRELASAGALTDTEIIDNEKDIPFWTAKKDYSNCEIGTPVRFNNQVYGLLVPHNAADFPSFTPETENFNWQVKHTQNPAAAKPYIPGIYMLNDCCIFNDRVWASAIDDNITEPNLENSNWNLII